jgi:paraquat-inducible protein A
VLRSQRVPERMPTKALIAANAGFMTCHVCHELNRAPRDEHGAVCVRCGADLHYRKPNSLTRAWALLIAATILYVPANVLHVTETSALTGVQRDTILSGVVYLWATGSWPVAALIFFASIMVPLAKIIALTLLLITTQRRSLWRQRDRAQLYRLVEVVGRWSMVDIYVIGLLVTLVQLGGLARIIAGPGAIAFGTVVVLTMFAAEAFDPRLIWDAGETDSGGT